MVKLILAIIIAGGSSGMDNWIWLPIGPDGGIVTSIASDGNNTLATARNNVWKYDGNTWSLVLNNIGSTVVLNTGQNQFCLIKASYDSARVYFSSNGGLTWTSTLSIIGSIEGYSRVNGSYVYIATYGTIYISNDGGYRWTPVAAPYAGLGVNNIAFSYLPDDPSTVYLAATLDSMGNNIFKLYKSTDYGATWSVISTTDYLIGTSNLAINPSNPQELVASVSIAESSQYPGLYVSEDGGATWNYIMSSLAAGLLATTDLVFKNDTLYIGSVITPGITRGVKVAGVWFFTRLDTIRMVHDIHITSDGTIYCGFSGGVLISTDGSTFADITNGLKAVYVPTDNRIVGNRVSVSTGGTLYLVDEIISIESNEPIFSNVIYRTTDYGMTWDKIYIPGVILPFSVQSPENNPATVYVSGLGYEFTNQGGFVLHLVYRSDDSANTFTPTDQGFSLDSLTGFYDVFWVSPTDPNNILAKFMTFEKGLKPAKQNMYVAYSSDAGQTFTPVLSNSLPLRASGSNDTIAIIVIENMMTPAVKVSTDRGHTWYRLPMVTVLPTDVLILNGNIYLAGVGTVYGDFTLLRTSLGQTSWDTVPGISQISGVVDAHLSGKEGFLAYQVMTDTAVFIEVMRATGKYYDILDFPATDFTLLGHDPTGSGHFALMAFTSGLSAYYTEDPFVGISEDFTDQKLVSIEYAARGPILNVRMDNPYRLEIFDLSGRKIFDKTLSDKRFELGSIKGSGIYFYRLKAENYRQFGKFVIFK